MQAGRSAPPVPLRPLVPERRARGHASFGSGSCLRAIARDPVHSGRACVDPFGSRLHRGRLGPVVCQAPVLLLAGTAPAHAIGDYLRWCRFRARAASARRRGSPARGRNLGGSSRLPPGIRRLRRLFLDADADQRDPARHEGAGRSVWSSSPRMRQASARPRLASTSLGEKDAAIRNSERACCHMP